MQVRLTRISLPLLVTIVTALLLPAALLYGKSRPTSTNSVHHHLLLRSSSHRQLIAPLLGLNEYVLGDFIVNVDEDAKSIQVSHSSDPDTTIWKTRHDENFLRAATGSADVRDNRGHFEIVDTINEETDDLTINATQLSSDGGSLIISGELLQAVNSTLVIRTPYEFTLATVPESSSQLAFSVVFSSPDTPYNRIFLSYHTTPDEQFFGFGEQFTHLNMKGRELTIITSENGIGRGEPGLLDIATNLLGVSGDFDSSYAPVPHYLTNLNHSLFLENYEVSVFDLTDPIRVTIKLLGTSLRGRIVYGDSPLDLIESYTEYAGRMERLPDWLNNGAVVGMQGGTDRVLEVLDELQALDTPIAAFWLQDWVGTRRTRLGSQLWWNWVLDEAQYPGWSDMVSEFNTFGIRVMTYVNPFLVDVSEADDYQGENLYRIALNEGYLVLDTEGEPVDIPNTDFSAAILDLSNPEAFDWMKGIIKENVINAASLSGWMADFGEALPLEDAVLASGEDPKTYHNKYPEEWARLNREAIEEAGRAGDIVFFSRSGFTRSPGISTLFWEGDQMVTWDENDGLKSAITGLLSSGISGFSLNHNDIGGYTTLVVPAVINISRSRELLFRWMELSAFTAVFRTHEGLRPDNNVQFYTDSGTYAQFARMAKVFAALSFYRSTLMDEAAEKGYPLVRHPFLHYPNDAVTYYLQYQWMLGSELMVAPVIDEGQLEVDVYLPGNSTWIHVWTLDAYPGGTWHVVDAPMGMPAVFFKQGSQVGAQFRANLQEMNVL